MEYHGGGKPKVNEIFENSIRSLSWFPVVRDIAVRNSLGRIWILGGFVYRNIIKEIYGNPQLPEPVDVDFLLEKKPVGGDLYLPEEWNPKMTDYGNLGLMMGNLKISLNYLFNFRSLLTRNLEPTLENLFRTIPLNVQGIVYSLEDRCISGFRGISAIKRRKVRINNLREARHEAERLEIDLGELVRRKAGELGFDYDLTLPPEEDNTPLNPALNEG